MSGLDENTVRFVRSRLGLDFSVFFPSMDESSEVLRELSELLDAVRGLTARVFELEKDRAPALKAESVAPPAAPAQPQEWTPLSAPVSASVPVAAQQPPVRRSSPMSQAKPVAERPDLESRIGSEWLNRIGITALLIGVSYFLKFAFDSNWIGPAGRVAIGLFAGIAVVAWSEWFRGRGHNAFSYSLKAVGIGCLYLSLWAAFQL